MAERVGLAFVGASRVETAAGTSFRPPQELVPALLDFTKTDFSTHFSPLFDACCCLLYGSVVLSTYTVDFLSFAGLTFSLSFRASPKRAAL